MFWLVACPHLFNATEFMSSKHNEEKDACTQSGLDGAWCPSELELPVVSGWSR